jgi:hypothetical protein
MRLNCVANIMMDSIVWQYNDGISKPRRSGRPYQPSNGTLEIEFSNFSALVSTSFFIFYFIK